MQPTPANRPPGTARSPLDDVPRPGSTPQIDAETRERLLENLSEYVDLPEPELEKSDREGQVGGDDIQIIAGDNLQFASVAVSEGGDIFVACQVIDPVTDHEIQVFRSSDGGTAWDLWGRYRDPDPGVSYIDPHIVVAEGSDNRCFIAACKYIDSPSGREIVVAWADLTDVTATFTEVVVMDDAARFWKPRLASDAASFNSYFLYVVAYGYDSSGTDIWFARSTNQGDSWESKYRIASQENDNLNYRNPDVCYGYGGKVHVAWHYEIDDDSYDTALRYRHAVNYATGGIDAWSDFQYLTSTANGVNELIPRIAASQTTDDVGIVYGRKPDLYIEEPGFFASTDQGVTFPVETIIEEGAESGKSLLWQSSTSSWILVGKYRQTEMTCAPAAAPTEWAPYQRFNDVNYPLELTRGYCAVLDPTHDERVATIWMIRDSDGVYRVFFDAEWRNDPGHPNLDPGFPLTLPHMPRSEPAVVDVDGDGDLEIVFTDTSDYINVLNHNGNPVSGWPAQLDSEISRSPVAIGDLNGDGLPEVVAATYDGRVFCFDSQANLMPGWPINTTDGEEAFVSIGYLGGSNRRLVVAAAGQTIEYFNYAGVAPVDLVPVSLLGSGNINEIAAIGDVTGDGQNEVVGSRGAYLRAHDPRSGTCWISWTAPAEVSEAMTLGDLDLDGRMEILVPLDNGVLHALDWPGGVMGEEWPFDSGTGAPLSSAAMAHCLGVMPEEVAVASQDQTVHLLLPNGHEQTLYPVHTSPGWWIYSSPIIGRVDGSSADVVLAARDDKGWAWDNLGYLVEGWPRELGDHVNLTAAMGDLDLDGSNEIVLLTLSELLVFDVNNTPDTPSRTWAMYGHDPQRTGCSDCPNDYFTAVGDESGITRVSFAMTSANPVQSSATFQFEVPMRAAARLEIFDVRGHRVRTVMRSEVPAGSHLTTWDGRDGNGQRIASGQYLARLLVQGPGLHESMIRKVTVLK